MATVLRGYRRSAPGHPDDSTTIPDSAIREPVDVEILVPVFNEIVRLPRTLAALTHHLAGRPWSSRVVVIDNGSWDDTGSVVRAFAAGPVDVVVVGCATPGKGAAVLRGLRTSGARFVGFTDSDLSTPLETLDLLLERLSSGAAAAIASRYAPGASVALPQPLPRRLGGHLFHTLAGGLVGGVRDTQCGFKFFDRAAVAAVLPSCRVTGFAFDVELLWHLHRRGGEIAEVPVVWTDDPRSSLRPLRDGVPALVSVAQLRHQALRHQALRHRALRHQALRHRAPGHRAVGNRALEHRIMDHRTARTTAPGR